MEYIPFTGSLEGYPYRLRINIAPTYTKAKRDTKKGLRRVCGVVGIALLFTFTFKSSYAYVSSMQDEYQNRLLDEGLKHFVYNNPTLVKVGKIVPSQSKISSDDEKIVIEWKGVFLGVGRDGKPMYSLKNPNYLIFDRRKYKLVE